MKLTFAHFKNRAGAVSVRSLALVLCFVMLVTAVGAGTMMTAFAKGRLAEEAYITDAAQKVVEIADAVDIPSPDEPTLIPALTRKVNELADTGAKADLASTGWDGSASLLTKANSYTVGSTTSTISSNECDFTVDFSTQTIEDGYWYFKLKANNSYFMHNGSINASGTTTLGKYDSESGTGASKIPVTSRNLTGKTITLHVKFQDNGADVSYTVSSPSETYTVVGSSTDVFGTEWAPTEEANNMENTTDNTWVKVYQDVPQVDIALKVAKDHAWTNSYPADDGNATDDNTDIDITYSSVSETKTTTNNDATLGWASHNTMTVTFDSETKDVTVTFADKYQINTTTNNMVYGTASSDVSYAVSGATVTITGNEDTGSFSSWTVISGGVTLTNSSSATTTFTMPAANVTVRANFVEFTGDSNFYYNGYNTSGGVLSSYYAKRMKLAKIGGQTYSYYHVTGRSGSEQPMTVSYGNLDYSSTYIYFQVPSGWTAINPNNDMYALFQSSDEVNWNDPDWSKMSYDRWDNSKKQFKIEVPDGARYVYFKDGTTNKQTVRIDLNTNSNNNENAWYLIDGLDGSNHKVSGFHNNDGLGTVGDICEFFWSGSNTNAEYARSTNFNNFYKFAEKAMNHGKTSSGNASHGFVKPNADMSSYSDYYVLVFSKGTTYTYNGDTIYDASKNTVVWCTELPAPEDLTVRAKVYAKDGCAPINWSNKLTNGASDISGTSYNYAAIADTAIYESDGTTAIGVDNSVNGSGYEEASVAEGEVICVKTTIADSITQNGVTINDLRKRYYVRGFCVNGVTYYGGAANQASNDNSAVNTAYYNSSGVYTLYYKLGTGEDIEDLEITPIFYLTDSTMVPYGNGQDGATFITFYLQNFEAVKDKGWGNTPFVYPFYGNCGGVANTFGSYPGQPMINVGGTYSIEVPLNNVTINKSVTDTHYTGETYTAANGGVYNKIPIKGITVSNGYADHVHRNKVYGWTDHDNDADHKQTYDYDDFYKIYREKETKGHMGVTSITLRLKYEDDTFNADEYGALGKGDQRVHGTKSTLTAAEVTAIGADGIGTDGTAGNGWELLTNFYNKQTDIFGTALTEAQKSNSALRVISTGYNANVAGDYGTAWMVYEPSGESYKLVTASSTSRYAIPPSIFNFNDDTSFTDANYPVASRYVSGAGDYTDEVSNYKAIYDYLKTNYTGHPVYVSYEKDQQDIRADASGTGAYRMDGHWYYTWANEQVSADIKIQVYNTDTGKYEDSAYTGEGSYADTHGNTAKFTSPDAKTQSKEFKTESYTFTASQGSGYEFKGWYVQTGTGSTPTPMTGIPMASASVLAEFSGTIIARFAKSSTGDVTITHNVAGSSEGKGTASLTAEVYDSSNTLQDTFGGDSYNSVYIDQTYITSANASAGYYIKIVLKAVPKLDDVFNSFVYDSKVEAEADPTLSPASGFTSGQTVTSTFKIAMSKLFNEGNISQTVKKLDYLSTYNATDHYYDITYNYTDRTGAAKRYTARGTLSADDYDKYVAVDGGTRTLSASFIKQTAPYLSNFNQNLSINFAGASITSNIYYASASDSHLAKTHYVTATIGSQASVYKALFSLPYAYYSDTTDPDADGDAVKLYTGQKVSTAVTEDGSSDTVNIVRKANATLVPFNSLAFESYILSAEATDTNVLKDSTTPNHVNNAFITAPKEIAVQDEGLSTYHKEYFSYWDVRDYTDRELQVTKVYYPDFNYRVYGNYFISPVYSDDPADSYNLAITKDFEAKILYLGATRNQWNLSGEGEDNETTTAAADLIYNDFAFSYNYNGNTIKDMNNVKVGMFVERIRKSTTEDGVTTYSYYQDDSARSDMSYYKEQYADKGDVFANDEDTQDKNRVVQIKKWLEGETNKLGMAGYNIDSTNPNWALSALNTKNRSERHYSFYSQYGQTVGDHSIEYFADSLVDNYIYRAYAYIVVDNDGILSAAVSEPAYFCMKYVSSK